MIKLGLQVANVRKPLIAAKRITENPSPKLPKAFRRSDSGRRNGRNCLGTVERKFGWRILSYILLVG